jgi:hypothetical protein
MDRNTNIAATPRCRVTEHELNVAKVKLLGLTILGIVSAVVIAVTGLPA